MTKEDFKKFAKEEFGYDIYFEKSDEPDTYESLFGSCKGCEHAPRLKSYIDNQIGIVRKQLYALIGEPMAESKHSTIEELEKKPCEDAISRADILEEIEKLRMSSGVTNQSTWNECVDVVLRTIKNKDWFPSVQPTLIKASDIKPDDAWMQENEWQKDHEILKAYSDGANGVLEEIRAEIAEEKEHAYADFERYKVEYLGQDEEDALDSLPQDDFRYGMERCIDIIDKYKAESEDKE